MGVGGHDAVAEGLPQQPDLGGGVEQILAPDDVGDPHVVIVDRVGDQENGRLVTAPDDEVFDGVVGELDPPPNDVVDDGHAPVGRPKSHHDARSVGHVAIAGPTVVSRRNPGIDRPLLDLVSAEVAEIGRTCRHQLVHRVGVKGAPLGLEIRSLVPVDPEPSKRFENRIDVGVGLEGGISVFDAQHQCPAGVAGVQPVEQRRTGAAYVQEPGGRRREPDAGTGHPPRLAAAVLRSGNRRFAPEQRFGPDQRSMMTIESITLSCQVCLLPSHSIQK